MINLLTENDLFFFFFVVVIYRFSHKDRKNDYLALKKKVLTQKLLSQAMH